MEDRLARMEADIRAIRQALVGYNGHGGGLIDDVRALEARVETLERRSWVIEGARAIVAGLAGIFGGRLGQ